MMVVALVGLTPAPANATNLPNNTHIKVEICHNGTIVPVSINAVAEAQDTGHGLLTLGAGGTLAAFAPHSEGKGHADDTVLRIYAKTGPVQLDLYVNPDQTCEKDPKPDPISVSVCFDGTVRVFDGSPKKVAADVAAFIAANPGAVEMTEGATCQKVVEVEVPVEVIKEVPVEVVKEVPVEKIVEKTVEVPGPTMVIERTVTTPGPTCAEIGATNFPTQDRNLDSDGDGIGCEVDAPAPATPPAAGPTGGELPKTGSPAQTLALLGTGLTGIGVVIRRFFK